jgi:hypothetical protein
VGELAKLIKLHRAESILEMALHSDTVLFECLNKDFENPKEVYSIMTKEIGALTGARIIKQNNGRPTGTFMVEALFTKHDDAEKAITQGFDIGGIQYKAIPTRSKNNELPKMVTIHVIGIPFAATDVLRDQLLESLAIYGKVCKISVLKDSGVFEGAITALLDTDPSQGDFEPLQKMLYLKTWDIFCPTNFRGQPPVCYHCRKVGHLKRDCPILAALQCFRCQGKGHIARHCRNDSLAPRKSVSPEDTPAVKKQKIEENTGKDEEKTEEKQRKNEKDEEKQLKKEENKQNENETTERKEGYDAHQAGGGRSPIVSISDSSICSNSNDNTPVDQEANNANQEKTDDEVMLDVSAQQDEVQGINKKIISSGMAASKYAPYESRSTMALDTRKEMDKEQKKLDDAKKKEELITTKKGALDISKRVRKPSNIPKGPGKSSSHPQDN